MRFLIATLSFCVFGANASWFWSEKTNIVEDLGPALSKDARIILRGDELYAEAAKRWQWWAAPDVAAVVDVKNEEDVRHTILYAKKHDIPFIVKSGGGGHGSIASLGTAKNAIQIWTKSLNHISISPSGNSATMGAGVNGKRVTDTLWAAKKQTVTGMCECVGLTAVALGGGHGLLQGYHGLLSDQILSLRMVLANGTAITVSETEHKDLFWGMRGAGHNFGMVTELEYKIYDVDVANGKDVWSLEAFVWPATRENTKKVYAAAKKSMNGQSPSYFSYGLVLIMPDFGPEPVILHHVVWNGPLTALKSHTQAFHDLDPISVTEEEGTYPDVPRWMQVDQAGMVCNADRFVPGGGILRFPVDMPDLNVEALAEAVDVFREATTSIKELGASFMMIEQYATNGVTKIDPNNSAFALRSHLLLLAPAFFYPALQQDGTPNTALDDVAFKYGGKIRKILADGAKAHGAYVNYANGDESLEEIYGESWRIEKLKNLKRSYDPENRFGFYAPIPMGDNGHSEL
ncbi:FAD-binding domain-containing protein [Polyplosphaeria fusca]|uniref:FAD-binding domain-containing protein n=1 Tax=Polyplosphaeria fusca TaxID=682080 RepID=A0A9P4QYT2_9PLEO|nr:FAD-binding domain-containing protein [Polyplosphaeria fusca]